MFPGIQSGSYPSLTSGYQAPLPSSQDTWDDADEQTTIYGGMLSTLGPGSPSSWTSAAVPPPPMSRPPAALPVPAAPDGVPPHTIIQHPAQSNRTWIYLGGAMLLVASVAFLLVALLKSRSGELVVTVSGPGNEELAQIEVFLDGQSICKQSPCRIPKIQAGTHTIKATAPGYKRTAEIALAIQSGAKAVHNVRLERDPGTGVRVTALGKGLTLFVDGKEVGTLPQEVPDLSPGEHTLKVVGRPRYADFEQTVRVRLDEMEDIGPLKLKVLEGLARIEAGANAEGASVILDSAGDRRTLPQLPITLQIDTARPAKLIATKPGFRPFMQDITFENGAAERNFVIELAPEQQVAAAPVSAPPRAAAVAAAVPRSAPAPAPAPAQPAVAAAPAGEVGKLNINAIPRASILLDGKPIGSTPKLGVEVSPGRHTVVLIAGELRKTAALTVKAGETRTVALRLSD